MLKIDQGPFSKKKIKVEKYEAKSLCTGCPLELDFFI